MGYKIATIIYQTFNKRSKTPRIILLRSNKNLINKYPILENIIKDLDYYISLLKKRSVGQLIWEIAKSQISLSKISQFDNKVSAMYRPIPILFQDGRYRYIFEMADTDTSRYRYKPIPIQADTDTFLKWPIPILGRYLYRPIYVSADTCIGRTMYRSITKSDDPAWFW